MKFAYDVERVALFRNERWDVIDPILQRVPFERVQFHGDETEDEVEAVDLPTINKINLILRRRMPALRRY